MALVIGNVDGLTIYAVLIGIGGYALILLLLMTSVAVVRYFRAPSTENVSVWKHTVAPILAALGLVAALVLATQNVAALIGGDEALATGLMALFYGSIVVGIIYALILRKKNNAVYLRIGRQEL
jgi:hypothetical protein